MPGRHGEKDYCLNHVRFQLHINSNSSSGYQSCLSHHISFFLYSSFLSFIHTAMSPSIANLMDFFAWCLLILHWTISVVLNSWSMLQLTWIGSKLEQERNFLCIKFTFFLKILSIQWINKWFISLTNNLLTHYFFFWSILIHYFNRVNDCSKFYNIA